MKRIVHYFIRSSENFALRSMHVIFAFIVMSYVTGCNAGGDEGLSQTMNELDLTGKVMNGPLAGAEIFIYNEDSELLGSTLSDENGNFYTKLMSAPPYLVVTEGGLLEGETYQGSMKAICQTSSNCFATPYTTVIVEMMDELGFNHDDAVSHLIGLTGIQHDPFLNQIENPEIFITDEARKKILNGSGLASWVNEFIEWIKDPRNSIPAGIPLSDIKPGVIVSDILGDTWRYETEAYFSISLTRKPRNDVIIQLSSSDITEGVLNKSEVVFTPENWNQPHHLEISGRNRNVLGSTQDYKINIGPITSGDLSYNAMIVESIDMNEVECSDCIWITEASCSAYDIRGDYTTYLWDIEGIARSSELYAYPSQGGGHDLSFRDFPYRSNTCSNWTAEIIADSDKGFISHCARGPNDPEQTYWRDIEYAAVAWAGLFRRNPDGSYIDPFYLNTVATVTYDLPCTPALKPSEYLKFLYVDSGTDIYKSVWLENTHETMRISYEIKEYYTPQGGIEMEGPTTYTGTIDSRENVFIGKTGRENPTTGPDTVYDYRLIDSTYEDSWRDPYIKQPRNSFP